MDWWENGVMEFPGQSRHSNTPALQNSVLSSYSVLFGSLLGDLLAIGLGRSGGGGRGSFGLDHAHLLFVFLEKDGPASFAHFLLARNAGTHFLGEIESRAHLALAGSRGLAKLLHGLAHLAAHHALQFGDRAFHHAGQILQRAANG